MVKMINQLLQKDTLVSSSVVELLKKYGSPAYIYDLDVLQSSYLRLKSILPEKSQILYSVKANPNPSVASKLISLGCLLELSSEGEIEVALQTGVNISKCPVTGPCKYDNYLEFCFNNGLRFFSAESINELLALEKIARIKKTRLKVILRVNPGSGAKRAGMHMMGVPSQFGIDFEELIENKNVCSSLKWLDITGFHFYMASNVNTTEGLLENYEEGINTAKLLSKELSLSLTYLNLGGGFAHPYGTSGEIPEFTGLREKLEDKLDEVLPDWRSEHFELVFESGRYLAANCGTLYMTVRDIKKSKGKNFVILDSGINHLGGMASLRKIPRFIPDIKTTSIEDNEACTYEIVGPLCTPIDKLAARKTLAELSINDIIGVPNVGAYGLTSSLIGFLSHPCPVEIATENNHVKEITKLELNRKKIEI
jgi:diaminopimelate decarboxylase